MNGLNPRSTAKIFGHPIHPMLIPFPMVFFISAFATDLLFLRNTEAGWATASMWLLGAGLGTAALAAAAGLTDFLGDARIRRLRDAWMHMLGNIAVVLLEAVNLFLRFAGPEVIGSVGVIISGLVVLILAFTGWKGGELVYRHRVGIEDGNGAAP